MVCKKAHRFWTRFKDLPADQGGNGRHRCAGCAFEAGRDAAIHGRSAPSPGELDLLMETMPESQAGTIRHKSPHEAFRQGFKEEAFMPRHRTRVPPAEAEAALQELLLAREPE